jgi:3-dehydroquinate dehydratase-2
VIILVINGPNLNLLGKRDPAVYGKLTLKQIQADLANMAGEQGIDLVYFQSNHEGGMIDFIQKYAGKAAGIVINPGALTHYGLSLRDALVDCGLPVIEIHLSNIYAREDWRARSVIAPVCNGQVTGFGPAGYRIAITALKDIILGGAKV